MQQSNLSFHDIRVALENKEYMSEDLLADKKVSKAFARIWIQLKKLLGFSREYRIGQVSKTIFEQFNTHKKHMSPSSVRITERDALIADIHEWQEMFKITRLLRQKLGNDKFLALYDSTLMLDSDFIKKVNKGESSLNSSNDILKDLEELEKVVLDPKYELELVEMYQIRENHVPIGDDDL